MREELIQNKLTNIIIKDQVRNSTRIALYKRFNIKLFNE